jgi:hypothetical protein
VPQRASAYRLLTIVGAVSWFGVGLAAVPALLHPSDTYAPGSSPCDPRGLDDAAAYALGAALVTLAMLAGWKLLRAAAAPAWAWGGIVLLVFGLATRRTTSFGCLSGSLDTIHDGPLASLVLAVLAVLGVVLLWRRHWRDGAEH